MLSSKFAADCLKALYNLDGLCEPLQGYTEINFKVTTKEGAKYVFKIINESEWNQQEWEFQVALFMQLENTNTQAPQLIPTISNDYHGKYKTFRVRLLTWQEGKILADLPFFTPSVMTSLARLAADNILALKDFKHTYASRSFKWNNDQGTWTESHWDMFSDDEQDLVKFFLKGFRLRKNEIDKLPKSIIHNDLNEFNLLYRSENYQPKVILAIDYGDACLTSQINNLAIAISYMLQRETDYIKVIDLMVSEYNNIIPLSISECKALYSLIGIRLVISVTQSRIAQEENPDNQYLSIHYRSSMGTLLKLRELGESLVTSIIINAAKLEAEEFNKWSDWAQKNPCDLSSLFPELLKSNCTEIDLGLESEHTPHEDHPYYEDEFATAVSRFQNRYQDNFIIGGYGEVRNLYVTEAFAQTSFGTKRHRTKHMGVDIWEPAGTKISSPWDGEIALIHKTDAHKDYGTVIIVEYTYPQGSFYLLFGHLSSESFTKHQIGDKIKKGATIGWLGSYDENGHWVPHLHLQVILDLLGKGVNFDGVARPDQWHFMSKICPDPAKLFPQLRSQSAELKKKDILEKRKKHLGYGLSLSYKDPLWIKRGKGCYLVDNQGQTYLDTVNNVAHVGHENYNIVYPAQRQLAYLNTNTRYLSSHIVDYADKLLATFPKKLSVVHFTNSGSEANELALRMAETYSKRKNILAVEVGYHGNTGRVIDVSSYKFDSSGGSGKPENTYLLPLPDSLRGQFMGDNSQKDYVDHAVKYIKDLSLQGVELAGFIHESILSCGGQIVLPEGYLQAVYKAVRAQGGVCIADEVQVGFGRTGKHFWAFELQDVIPDIVVLGKPIGNGHPMGAVICTEEIAYAFDNGMEYFNTFGGNPVSAIVGKAVIDEIENKKLQQNAWLVGTYLKRSLEHICSDFPIIADVRGHGLFLGIEFLDEAGNPDADFAHAFSEHMLARKILISTDGPDHNVIKIKPPITFQLEHADILLKNIREVLALLTVLRG